MHNGRTITEQKHAGSESDSTPESFSSIVYRLLQNCIWAFGLAVIIFSGFSQGAAATWTLSGNQTNSSAITLSADENIAVNGTGTLFQTGNISRSYHTLSFSGSANLTISGTVSGGYTIMTKNGTGTLTLSGANTFDGPVVINAGVVNLQNSSALGTSTHGNEIYSGAALELQNNITVSEGNFGIRGTGVSGGGALRNVSGNNTYSGTLTVESAASVIAAAGSLTLSGPLAADNDITFGGAGNITLSGQGYGNGNVTKEGSGTLTFSGSQNISISGEMRVYGGTMVLNKTSANTFNNSFIVGDGSGTDTLQLGAANQIADHLTIKVNSGGVFNLNGFSETITKLNLTNGTINTGAGTLTLKGDTAAVTVNAHASSSTINGVLSMTGNQAEFNVANGAAAVDLNLAATTTLTDGLKKTGAGTMQITGTITTGSDLANDRLSIDAGTLLLGAANRISDNTPIRLNGGTFDTGGFSDNVGVLTLDANSTINMGSGNTSVLGFTSGTYSGGTLTVTGWSGNANGTGNERLEFGAMLSQSFLTNITFSGYAPGAQQILVGGKYVIVPATPVPEPATVTVCVLLAGVVGYRERTRLRRWFSSGTTPKE